MKNDEVKKIIDEAVLKADDLYQPNHYGAKILKKGAKLVSEGVLSPDSIITALCTANNGELAIQFINRLEKAMAKESSQREAPYGA